MKLQRLQQTFVDLRLQREMLAELVEDKEGDSSSTEGSVPAPKDTIYTKGQANLFATRAQLPDFADRPSRSIDTGKPDAASRASSYTVALPSEQLWKRLRELNNQSQKFTPFRSRVAEMKGKLEPLVRRVRLTALAHRCRTAVSHCRKGWLRSFQRRTVLCSVLSLVAVTVGVIHLWPQASSTAGAAPNAAPPIVPSGGSSTTAFALNSSKPDQFAAKSLTTGAVPSAAVPSAAVPSAHSAAEPSAAEPPASEPLADVSLAVEPALKDTSAVAPSTTVPSAAVPPAGDLRPRAAIDATTEGRYVDAIKLYDELALAHPDRPEYRAAHRVLQRRLRELK